MLSWWLFRAIRATALFTTVTALFTSSQAASACTDFQLRAADGSVICGRSMEWADPLGSQLRFQARGQRNGNKFGFIEANAYDMDAIVDGMNEQGLSFDALWLPGTVYQTPPAGAEEKTIDALQLGGWMLGNFATVDEALTALRQRYVVCSPIRQLGGVPTLHIALHDATGKNAVIEFVDGQQRIYDNPNGVLTNAPTFDWHMTNLRNYIHVDAANPKPIIVAGTVLAPPGQGSGFLGIPGDWTPPSRFVRATAMRAFAKQPATARDGAILAAHILNAVDIPKGAIRDNLGGKLTTDYTQWTVVKDLTNKKLWYRGYNDLAPKSVDLSKINWEGKMPSPLTMDPES